MAFLRRPKRTYQPFWHISPLHSHFQSVFLFHNPLQTHINAPFRHRSSLCYDTPMQTLKKPFLCFLLFLLAIPSPLLGKQRDRRLEAILRDEGIRPYKVAIHLQSKKWLIKEFGPGRKYPIDLTLATKNIVWQTRKKIRKGKMKPINGSIRTFWYTHIKPVFARTGSFNTETNQPAILHDVLVELVRDHNIMRYKDMGFIDHNAAKVRIGPNWHVMIVGEKHGKYGVLEKMAKELNCTAFTVGGQPSLLSMEYLVDHYKARDIDIRKSMYLIFVVDHDPAGWIIQSSVVNDLKFYGIKNIKAIDIISPDILTSKELELAKYPIPENQAKRDEWLEETGGINGQLYGFESDSVPPERLHQKITEAATPFVGSPEIIRRANAVRALHEALDQLLQTRLRLGQ